MVKHTSRTKEMEGTLDRHLSEMAVTLKQIRRELRRIRKAITGEEESE